MKKCNAGLEEGSKLLLDSFTRGVPRAGTFSVARGSVRQ